MLLNKLLLLSFIIIAVNGSKYNNFTSKCCDENKFIIEFNCKTDKNDLEDSDNINLNCTSGKFLIDPNDEKYMKFYENNKNELIMIDDSNETKKTEAIIQSKFWCVDDYWDAKNNKKYEEKIAMICFDDDYDEEFGFNKSEISSAIFATFLYISSIFMIITLIIYISLPELRDLQGKCLMCNLIALSIAFLFLGSLQLFGADLSDNVCLFKAFSLYFWLLSSFFWLNVISFNVWRSVYLQKKYKVFDDGKIFLIYNIYAWGVPTLLLLITLCGHYSPKEWISLKPGFGIEKCWFSQTTETWAYFYGPISLLLSMNILFYISSAYVLWIDSRNDHLQPKIRSRKYRCILYFKFFFIMGISWIFEVISFAHGKMTWYWHVTDICNCLQGILMFLILVVFRKRTLQAMARRQWDKYLPCKFSTHQIMSQVDEEITDNIISNEEHELHNDIANYKM